jgi:hypothetical protein
MLELSTALTVRKRSAGHGSHALAGSESRPLVERVRERIAHLTCQCVWARGAGSHVLLGLRGEDAYARVSPIRGTLYGLAFRAVTSRGHGHDRWDGLLLIDTLADVVEHALIAVDALSKPGDSKGASEPAALTDSLYETL